MATLHLVAYTVCPFVNLSILWSAPDCTEQLQFTPVTDQLMSTSCGAAHWEH